MIKIKKITKSFNQDLLKKTFKALDEVSFQINENKITGYLGANGAGKTTSLKIIMGFIRATSGEIEYGRTLGGNFKSALKNIGYLPERPYFYPDLTGREFVTYLAQLSGLSLNYIKSNISDYFEKFFLIQGIDRKVRTYSKGMLQRLGFIAAIIHKPKLVILDEPLSGLDPIGRKQMKDAILQLHQEGASIFFSSHIVPDIEDICHEVLFIDKGKLVYQGGVQELLISHQGSDWIIRILKEHSDLLKNLNIELKLEHEGSYIRFKCTDVEKNVFIENLVKLNIPIQYLEREKISLEEILYKVKS